MARRPKTLLAARFAAALLFASAPALGAPVPLSSGAPVLLSADEVTYDQTHDVVTARGKVEIAQGERVLLADVISYNRRANSVTASGNVSLMEPNGDVVFADHVELTDDLRDGAIESIRILLSNNARIAANSGRRSGGTRTEMSRAVYSPCDVCKEDPSRPPFWQIKAVRVVHDQTRQTVEYYDAVLEMAGVPVAYVPYFSHYDPTVKRRSGFLAPVFGSSSDLGLRLETPYFWAISPSRDATLRPILTGKEGLVMAGEYRERFGYGELKLDGSLTRDSHNDDRGHIFGRGVFNLDDTWRWGFDAERTTDDTYLRRYNLSSKRTLTSGTYIEGFRGSNYALADAYLFQGLRETDRPGQTPVVLPRLRYERIGEPGAYGQRTSFNFDSYVITRTDGTDTRRLGLDGGWQLPYTSPRGDVYVLSANVQAAGYHFNQLPDPSTPSERTRSGFEGRLFPQLALDWRYPFVREAGVTSQVISPLVSVVAAPNGGNAPLIPNEDSLDFEFTDANLFSRNRFAGRDRVEGGPRLNYGFLGGVYGLGGGSAGALVGQSLRARSDDTFAQDSGLEDRVSDVVGRVFISPLKFLDLNYRFRLDKNNLEARFNEVGLRAGPPALNLKLDYIFTDRSEQLTEFESREEVSGAIGSRLTNEWSMALRGRRDLTGKGDMISQGLELTYENECFVFRMDAERSFTSDRDITRSDRIMFRLVFKTIGEFETSAR
ncbi:MAG: LPS-assembly protein LptD [Proteobacteria bacterium]|nr:LPS-assembly protein LptD [Pseudomonadota bacterium]